MSVSTEIVPVSSHATQSSLHDASVSFSAGPESSEATPVSIQDTPELIHDASVSAQTDRAPPPNFDENTDPC